MTLSVEDYLSAITHHSQGLAEADEERRPRRAPDAKLVDRFLAGAENLVSVLDSADQSALCWTWATQKDVAFITRHQVQEAAVHHWDAVAAARKGLGSFAGGPRWEIMHDVAVDSVEEFLTCSVSSDDDPADRPPLNGTIWLCACVEVDDVDHPTWIVTDGERPGTIAWHRDDTNAEDLGGHVTGGHCSAAGRCCGSTAATSPRTTTSLKSRIRWCSASGPSASPTN